MFYVFDSLACKFFLIDASPSDLYMFLNTVTLHDALPILTEFEPQAAIAPNAYDDATMLLARPGLDGDQSTWRPDPAGTPAPAPGSAKAGRPEEHTSELQSLMRISYAVFCLTIKKPKTKRTNSLTMQPLQRPNKLMI